MQKKIHMSWVTEILLFLFMVCCTALHADSVPSKTVVIYNNSDKTIYPILEMPIMGVDLWLQAEFKTTNPGQELYSHTKCFRVYINTLEGIKANSSATINLPLYSQLVQNPNPTKSDQYINWWNGGRIYLYDNKQALNLVYNQDQANAITTVTPGVTYANNSKPLKIFTSKSGLPLNDPYQLIEYTFGNLDLQTIPYKIFHEYVDYDISYVDHVYLPIAIEPYGNSSVGYTGTVTDLTTFRNTLTQFAADYEWPHYVQNPQYPNLRLPGTYNLLIGVELTPKESVAKQNLENLWIGCANNNSGSVCQNIAVVKDLFIKNYDKYLTLPCESHLPLTLPLFLQHVYGWVPFNECSSNGIDNALYNTPGVNYEQVAQAYHDLQYSYLTTPHSAFNPYVELIHGKNYLHMDAYAYSIDDAVGNINTLGEGLIATIGGINGLPNGQPYVRNNTPQAGLNVNLGAPSPQGTKWAYYSLGTTAPNIPLNGQLSIQISSKDFPLTFNLQDSIGRLYQITIPHAAPLKTSDLTFPTGNAWYQSILVDPNTQKDINTPPPPN